jgi:hypothetical protein
MLLAGVIAGDKSRAIEMEGNVNEGTRGMGW